MAAGNQAGESSVPGRAGKATIAKGCSAPAAVASAPGYLALILPSSDYLGPPPTPGMPGFCLLLQWASLLCLGTEMLV